MAFFFGEHPLDLESPDIRGHATPSLSCVWAEGGSSSHNRSLDHLQRVEQRTDRGSWVSYSSASLPLETRSNESFPPERTSEVMQSKLLIH